MTFLVLSQEIVILKKLETQNCIEAIPCLEGLNLEDILLSEEIFRSLLASFGTARVGISR